MPATRCVAGFTAFTHCESAPTESSTTSQTTTRRSESPPSATARLPTVPIHANRFSHSLGGIQYCHKITESPGWTVPKPSDSLRRNDHQDLGKRLLHAPSSSRHRPKSSPPGVPTHRLHEVLEEAVEVPTLSPTLHFFLGPLDR